MKKFNLDSNLISAFKKKSRVSEKKKRNASSRIFEFEYFILRFSVSTSAWKKSRKFIHFSEHCKDLSLKKSKSAGVATLLGVISSPRIPCKSFWAEKRYWKFICDIIRNMSDKLFTIYNAEIQAIKVLIWIHC